jgi:aquaporin Z
MSQSTRCLIAEFLGTFILVFVGTAVATLQGFMPGHEGTGWLEISFAFGGTLMILVLVIGPISGCHINPAVSIAMALSGRLKKNQLPGYIISQCVGAIAASFVLKTLLSGIPVYDFAQHGLAANGNPLEMTQGMLFAWELIVTALFLFTILAATRSDTTPGFAALAIGGFLFVAHLIGAQLGDSSLNPARSLGPALFVGGAAMKVLWIFVVGPIAGAILGWLMYKVVYDD